MIRTFIILIIARNLVFRPRGGVLIRRSNVNVIVDGLVHHIRGEGDHGAPYSGFINIGNCANVTVQNTVLTGHKTYRTIGSAGLHGLL